MSSNIISCNSVSRQTTWRRTDQVEMVDMAADVQIDNNNKSQTKKSKRRLSPKCRQIIELVIVIVCVAGLVYQAVDLVNQFLKRQTVVHLDFETLWYNRLPAITICYPYFVSMNKTAQRFAHLRKDFNEYKKIIKVGSTSEQSFHDQELQTKLIKIYEKFFAVINQNNISFGQLTELSIPFDFNFNIDNSFVNNGRNDMPGAAMPSDIKRPDQFKATVPVPTNDDLSAINIQVSGLNRFKNETIKKLRFEDREPVESVVLSNDNQTAKCFTFFSHLNKKMLFYQMNVKYFSIIVRHHNDWFPPMMYTKYHQGNYKLLFAMHSPNTIPQRWDTFMELEAGYLYEIRYNRWKTVLLGPPYKTKCTNYNVNAKKGFRLRSDCINRCITSRLDKECFDCDLYRNKSQCKPCFIRSEYLWRVNTARVDQNINRHLCPNLPDQEKDRTFVDRCLERHQDRTRLECETECLPECYNRYYNFHVFAKDPMRDWKKDTNQQYSNWNVETQLYIGHNHMPDQTTKHIPEMTFVSFAGTFGGLFGVWMGLSAYAILRYLLKLV